MGLGRKSSEETRVSLRYLHADSRARGRVKEHAIDVCAHNEASAARLPGVRVGGGSGGGGIRARVRAARASVMRGGRVNVRRNDSVARVGEVRGERGLLAAP